MGCQAGRERIVLKIVALDIGNTSDKLALLVGTPPRVKFVKAFDSVPSVIPPIPEGFDSIYINSVVPYKTEEWRSRFSEQAKVKLIKELGRDFIKKVSMKGPEPQKVGSDRILAILGAMVRKTPPFIVIDSGTAITFNVVNEEGIFIGGFIAPGFKKLLSSISSCALVPDISFEKLVFQDSFGGKTEESVSAGIYNYVKGALDLALGKAEEIFSKEPNLIFTGGYGNILRDWVDRGEYYPHLVLEGIAVAAT